MKTQRLRRPGISLDALKAWGRQVTSICGQPIGNANRSLPRLERRGDVLRQHMDAALLPSLPANSVGQKVQRLGGAIVATMIAVAPSRSRPTC